MTDQPDPLQLYIGKTSHARFTPFEFRFSYNIALIDIDIDRLDEASACSSLFKAEKSALFSFRRKDHGARTDNPLRPWALSQFAKADVDLDGGPIRLVTFPRHAFYKFAPISLWYGYGPDGQLRGVIYEVNNTFGETHAYVAAANNEPGRTLADKAFHVSPFFDISGKYRFTMRPPGACLDLVIDSLDGDQRTHMANIVARARPATTPQFARLALMMPLSTLGVTFAIHWQALKLWIKGAKYRPKPPLPAHDTSVARAIPFTTDHLKAAHD